LQLAQTVDPSFSEYVPSRQSVQAAAAEEVAPGWLYLPTAHKKPEHVEASAVAWNLPASQSVQTVAPEPATEYFPAPQAVQTEAPAAADLPAPHSSQAVLIPAAALYLPAPHSTHPVVVKYLPASHLKQTLDPEFASVYLPAAQSAQTDAPASEKVPGQ
jgi:hypothetical protein